MNFPIFRWLGSHEFAFLRFGYERFVSSTLGPGSHPAWRAYYRKSWLNLNRGERWEFSIRVEEALGCAAMVYGVARCDGILAELAGHERGGLSAGAKHVLAYTFYGVDSMEPPNAEAPVSVVSVEDIAHAIGQVDLRGPIAWGEDLPSTKPGIYLVEVPGASVRPQLVPSTLRAWLGNWHGGKKPESYESLRRQLLERWHPRSQVVYVGRASNSLRKRVAQFYQHAIGDPSPHAGGQSLLTLAPETAPRVWWCECSDARAFKLWALRAHADCLAGTQEPRGNLLTLLPFANRTY